MPSPVVNAGPARETDVFDRLGGLMLRAQVHENAFHHLETLRGRERINLFEKHCLLISAEAWKKVAPDDHERAVLLNKLAYDHLLAHRWGIAEGLSQFVIGDKKMPEVSRTIATGEARRF